MAPQKFERKKGFYFNPDAAKKIDMDVVDKGGIDIDKLDKLNYEKAADGEGYFVYYEGSDQKQLDEIYNRLPFEYLYANEHYEDIKWCQENKDFLQREIKESFDAKFAEYGDDFKFDMDFFNYAFLGEEPSSASINLVSEAEMRGFESKGEKKKSSIAQLHEDVDKILETAAENNKEFGLSDAIHQKSEDLKKESKWADPASCRKAMKLAMADYSHKIMKLDMPLDKKKELFGDLMVAYADTMSMMITTIGGYEKDYNVENIDFGCLKSDQLIKEMNEVVPTEFFFGKVDKNADKDKNIDDVIKRSTESKKLKVEDKEFVGQTYKIAKENYGKHNRWQLFWSKVPFFYPSIKKERETIEKIENFTKKFDLGETMADKIEHLTGITGAKKDKAVADMADKIVKKTEIDVNKLVSTIGKVEGVEKLGAGNRFRTMNKYAASPYVSILNRYYAGQALEKISQLKGVKDYYDVSLDKSEFCSLNKNTKYLSNGEMEKVNWQKNQIEAETIRGKYIEICNNTDREASIMSLDLKGDKIFKFSLDKEVQKADIKLQTLDCDVAMNGYEIQAEQNIKEEQENFVDLDNLHKDTGSKEIAGKEKSEKLSSSLENEREINEINSVDKTF